MSDRSGTDHGVDALFAPDPHPDDVYSDDVQRDNRVAEPGAAWQQADTRPRRADRHRRPPKRRRRRVVAVLAVLVAALLVVGGFVAARGLGSVFSAADYSGDGTGSVVVEVRAGDGAAQIGDTLVQQKVVASRRAFVDAARKSNRSTDFQAGFFALHRHMSSTSAVDALLDPANRRSLKAQFPEGVTTIASQTPSVPRVLAATLSTNAASVTRTLTTQVRGLGIPSTYGSPTSAEGFLFPSTYAFDPGTTTLQALQQMVVNFSTQDRQLSFSTKSAASLNSTPYAKLIIASIVESEARFDGDRGKVAQVLYNRIKAGMPLQSDATSAYGAKAAGQDPTKIDYQKPAPYNTRLKAGLPPTPIDNPGLASMRAAAQPTAGNWIYFVSSDAAGHLYFTNSYSAFLAASKKCEQNKWGCS